MPDPTTYKTFLSPGSCQLEVTDLVAAANDDTGVDLYGVAWEIEQVLIAGEGFAASPTDVWVNERGILNIGQSLFDKINRTALNNTNIPGQCTVIVKATSLVDSSKVARLKVLVGYPGKDQGYLKPTGTITITENGEGIDVAQYATADVSVSGGGGVTLGNVNYVFSEDITAAVGDEISGGPTILTVAIGDSVIAEWGKELDFPISKAAAGTDIVMKLDSYDVEGTYSAVARTFTVDFTDYTYATISQPIDLAVTVTHDATNVYAEFTMPQLNEGVGLMLSPTHE